MNIKLVISSVTEFAHWKINFTKRYKNSSSTCIPKRTPLSPWICTWCSGADSSLCMKVHHHRSWAGTHNPAYPEQTVTQQLQLHNPELACVLSVCKWDCHHMNINAKWNHESLHMSVCEPQINILETGTMPWIDYSKIQVCLQEVQMHFLGNIFTALSNLSLPLACACIRQ